MDLNDFEATLKIAGDFHGDVCAGIRIGTRMSMCGLKRIGIADPKGADKKKLIVFVEIDRCATDAIMAITGCRPGKRTMKIYDYGKMAATFHNLETGRSVRVQSRPKQPQDKGDMPDFSVLPDEALFTIQEVEVMLRPEDLPGLPLRACACAQCGGNVMDGRDVMVDGRTLCKPCAAGEDYFKAK
jgi:formylmethanofuran dehydrogenase subunit E